MRHGLNLAGLLIICNLGSNPVAAQSRKATQPFAPACNLHELNRAYVTALNRLRHQLDPHALPVQFDSGLFPGTVLHVKKLEQTDSLFHAQIPELRSAELCGTKYNLASTDPTKIAQYMLLGFENSEPHCAIQSDPGYVFVAIAASKHYAVVRLSHEPTPSTKKERVAYLKLGVD
ncbi:MAG: hypothetical protein EOO61_22415 [Hymenobacter sp.]|nr:MAG: hypothetical protein EOO61_22415 [Hymenobacter sp.]